MSAAPQPNNPYQSPQAAALAPVVGPWSPNPQHHPEHLRRAAEYQRGLQMAILAQIIAYVAVVGIQEPLVKQIFLGVVALAGLAGAAYVFLLANHLWGIGWAIATLVIGLIPCLGLLALLRVNSAATALISEAGYTVGLLGADPAQFDHPPPNAPAGMPYPPPPGGYPAAPPAAPPGAADPAPPKSP